MKNVLCIKWGNKFSAGYVNRLYSMVERHLSLSHRFVCLTEDTTGLNSEIETKPLLRKDLKHSYTKFELFEKKLHDITGQILFLDLDVVINNGAVDNPQSSIDDLFFSSDAVIEADSLAFRDKNQGDGFELIHTVIPSSANVRSKPSMDGHVIAIVEEGMNLTLIEKKRDWTKIRVFEKTGWIASRLIKSEVQTIK